MMRAVLRSANAAAWDQSKTLRSALRQLHTEHEAALKPRHKNWNRIQVIEAEIDRLEKQRAELLAEKS